MDLIVKVIKLKYNKFYKIKFINIDVKQILTMFIKNKENIIMIQKYKHLKTN